MADQTNTEILTLLETALDNVPLVQGLQRLALRDLQGVRQADHLWAVPLYQRDTFFFEQFIIDHLSRAETANVLLPFVEANRRDILFRAVYTVVASEERWRSDIHALLNTADVDRIMWGIGARSGQWAKPDLELLLRIYRHSEKLRERLQGNLANSGGYLHLSKEVGRQFFEALQRERKPDSAIYWGLFRSYATPEEWHAALRDLLKRRTKPDDILKWLQALHPNQGGDMPLAVMDELLKKYGRTAVPYFEQNSKNYAMRQLQALLSQEADDEKLLRKLQKMTAANDQNMLRFSVDFWAPALYDRNPELFGKLIVGYARSLSESVSEKLRERAQREKRYTFFQELYRSTVKKERWNADLLALARSELPAGAIEKEFPRFEMDYMHLDDEPAAALYVRDPELFRAFVKSHLASRYVHRYHKLEPYPRLLEAARQTGDIEFADWLFRRMMAPDEWQSAMASLLAQDIPSEEIVTALERIKPFYPAEINPGILTQFLDKYGEAVLPFFERYVNWATRPRIESLLALNLERGELLRELQAIANRQAQELSQIADVWAIHLYELGPSFFSSFLIRYIGRESPYTIRALLPRIEADGRLEMFQALYMLIIRQEEWLQEVKTLAVSDLSETDLIRKIKMRDFTANRGRIRWYFLDDQAALLLYRRSPDQFRNFIRRAVRSAGSYPELLAAVKANGDIELYEHLFRELEMFTYWHRELQQNLDRNLPAREAAAALEKLGLPNSWGTKDWSILIKYIDRYGQAVMPFILKHISRMGHKDNQVYQHIRKIGDEPTRWQALFAMGTAEGRDKEWRKALEDAFRRSRSEEEFAARLKILTPPVTGYRTWTLPTSILLRFYEKYPRAVPELIRACLKNNNGHIPYFDGDLSDDGDIPF